MNSIAASVASAPPGNSMFQGVGLRLLSAAVLIPLAVGALWWGDWAFLILVAAFAGLMLSEWRALTGGDRRWFMLGLVYIVLPCASLIWIRDSQGFAATLWLFVAVWASDTGAYVAGRLIGGPKLWPSVSPNKTWAGLGGAVAGAALLGLAALWLLPGADARLILGGGVIGLIGQAGDLFESWMKRRAGVKDSGTLIPGHGGALDRLDSMLFVAPAAALTLLAVR